jgi:hypothetical protein
MKSIPVNVPRDSFFAMANVSSHHTMTITAVLSAHVQAQTPRARISWAMTAKRMADYAEMANAHVLRGLGAPLKVRNNRDVLIRVPTKHAMRR